MGLIMVRTVIIDDEKPSRDRVRFFLSDYNEISIVGEAENGESGIVLLNKENPQLVFLDIQMPIADGFHVLKSCSYRPAVIFISAYDEYAIQAFDVNAVDYLLKPYTKQRFYEAVERVLSNIDDSTYWDKKISSILETYNSRDKYLDRITVKNGYVYKIYEIENIDFFKIDDGLLFLYAGGKRITLDTPLSQLEKRLDPAVFFRAHRKAFVNLKKIRGVIPWGQGRYALDFGDSGKVQVSRDSVKLLKQKIGLKI